MTNFEKYKDKIIDASRKDWNGEIGIIKRTDNVIDILPCEGCNCELCFFNNFSSCISAMIEWFAEDWRENLKPGTIVQVKNEQLNGEFIITAEAEDSTIDGSSRYWFLNKDGCFNITQKSDIVKVIGFCDGVADFLEGKNEQDK